MRLKSIVAVIACLALSACLLTAYAPAYAASGSDGSLTAAKTTAQATAKKKARNPLTVRVTKLGVNGKALKSKSKTVKALTVTKAKGEKSFKVARWTTKKAKRCFKLNKKTGKVTVKRGTPAGTYKFKVKVTAAGNKSYKAGSKTVAVKIMVKNKTWVEEQGHWEPVYTTVVDQEAYTTYTRLYIAADGYTSTDSEAFDIYCAERGLCCTWEDIPEEHPAVTHQEHTGKKWAVDVPGHWE